MARYTSKLYKGVALQDYTQSAVYFTGIGHEAMAGIPSTKVTMNAFVLKARQMRDKGIKMPKPIATCREEASLPPGVPLEAYKEMRRSFVAKSSDVFIVSYPKSGTTWMQYVVSLIKNNGVDDGEDLDDKWLWMDIFTQEEVEVGTN